jgi:hypothetical protein
MRMKGQLRGWKKRSETRERERVASAFFVVPEKLGVRGRDV